MARKVKSKKTLFSVFTTIELIIVGILFAAIVLPLPFGINPQIVETASMSPKIPAGSIAWTTSNFVKDDLTPGTVAVYEPELGTLVMHRIDSVEDGHYIFKGDANNAVDLAEPIAEQVRGIYLFHIPQIGQYFDWIMENKFVIIFVFVLLNVGVYSLSMLLVWLDSRESKHKSQDKVETLPESGESNFA